MVATPVQFDKIYDAGLADYLAAGGQDIIDERAEKIGCELKQLHNQSMGDSAAVLSSFLLYHKRSVFKG